MSWPLLARKLLKGALAGHGVPEEGSATLRDIENHFIGCGY